MYFSDENHFTFYWEYENKIYDYPVEHSKYVLKFSKVKNLFSSYKKCFYETIKNIIKHEPSLCLSGKDSLIILLGMLEFDYKPTINYFYVKNYENETEKDYVEYYCKKYDLKKNFVYIDYEKYINLVNEYSEKYRILSPRIVTTLYLLDHSYVPVFGGGDITFFYLKNKNKWVTRFKTQSNLVYRKAKEYNIKCIPNFHSYSPELIYYFINHENDLFYMKYPKSTNIFDTSFLKIYKYCSLTKLEIIDVEKYHTFEKLKEKKIEIDIFKSLNKKNLYYNHYLYVTFEDLNEHLVSGKDMNVFFSENPDGIWQRNVLQWLNSNYFD